MAETIKDQSRVEIKLHEPAAPPDFTEESQRAHRIPFFGSSFKKKESTWVISLFVVLHLVVFAATMFVNDCSTNSQGDCVLKPLGRLSFQSFRENPLLGPSPSALDQMGALRRALAIEQHQTWRILSCVWLHAGVIHLIINLSSIIFIGIHLEQEFGSWRVGAIYMLSAFLGSLLAVLFVQKSLAVGSSGALFGLLGAMLSAIIQNWSVYADKFAALIALLFVMVINLALGLLPYVDTFSNIGGFLSGFLLGFVLLFNPQLAQVTQNKGGLFEYDVKSSVKLKHKLDKPVQRSVFLVLFCLVLGGVLIAVLNGVDANKFCGWCHYVNCVPSKRWSCNNKDIPCEVTVSTGRLMLTCIGNDNFQIYPFTSVSQARIGDLCSLICS